MTTRFLATCDRSALRVAGDNRCGRMPFSGSEPWRLHGLGLSDFTFQTRRAGWRCNNCERPPSSPQGRIEG
jgi:hypothetical protein